MVWTASVDAVSVKLVEGGLATRYRYFAREQPRSKAGRSCETRAQRMVIFNLGEVRSSFGIGIETSCIGCGPKSAGLLMEPA